MDNLQPSSSHVETKKILILEDEETVSRFIRFALEPAHKVVIVSNGADGVREVQAGDFDVIICDMMMPKLPGDMFYFAVERTKPHLCSRFIFMTGLKDDEKINAFIKKIGGLMLAKPFKAPDLLEMIAFVQVRSHLGA
ncbi:MAG TPA: response regulator [Chthoniobacteraceae bacterium]|nr:response regulator [Chthoniobacteraceae bacterium]